MAYLPIEDHGIIGNLQTVALVGTNGRIDWCCMPNFDSPSVFAAILDDKKGGSFSLHADATVNQKQQYLPDTAILVTRSYCESGLGQIEDFMPVSDNGGGQTAGQQIFRRVSCVRGEVRYTMECSPAFDYARASHKVHIKEEGAIFETEGDDTFVLSSPVKLKKKGSGVTSEFRLKQGESISFCFFKLERKTSNPLSKVPSAKSAFEKTYTFWRNWMSHCAYTGRWREVIRRSALTLKLLTFKPTGAIVAAATMGLPEGIGGARNWDYRYTWIRDAAFSLYGLMRIGYTEEARDFMNWLAKRASEAELDAENPLQIMYGIDGRHKLEETVLKHLEGYKKSKPVRLGNAAYDQLQLDIYGELMDSIYLYNKYGTPVSYRLWEHCRRLADWVSENWAKPDEGIWETRGGRQHFVYSRLMCWVALDRTSRMSLKHSLPGDRAKWMIERDKIYDEIMTRGWNEERQAFRQHYDTDALDAANLLMPLVKFISPTDPRMVSTINATLEELTTDSLVYRYDPEKSPDGLPGEEGTFCICTFWLVECLTRCGRTQEARLIFERMLGYANHVGLFAEEIGNHGEHLGNFPQAFTHLSLISAGYNLNRELDGR